MSVRIVLFPVTNSDRRADAEHVENTTFNPTTFNEYCNKMGDVLTYSLTDFMDACNNQEIELEGYWLSYVNVVDI